MFTNSILENNFERSHLMRPFTPQLVYFEPKALEYPLGKLLKNNFDELGTEIRYTTSHNQVRNLPGDNDFQKYRIAKSTLVVGIRKTLKFDTSKPSAEYAIPLATGCMGHCHYCYLQTTMGSKIGRASCRERVWV